MAATDGRTMGTSLDIKQSKDARYLSSEEMPTVYLRGAELPVKICFRLPGRRLCRRGRHRQEGRRRIGPKDKLGRRWRSSGGSPPPPPPRSPPPTSHPPLPEARRFSPGNLWALLPPDSGSTGSKLLLLYTEHTRNSPHELLPTTMALCTGHNHGLRIIST